MTMATAALRADELYRFFRTGGEEILALRGVSLSVESGESVVVVGPSGSGKSTLLGCLAGLDEPAGGTVTVGGEQISHRSEAVRARVRARRVGVLLQSRNLLPHLSVQGNVRIAQAADHHRSPDRPTIGHLLEQVGLTAQRHARPSQLSGGELARAGLAVALANAPDIVLADEPTGELDGHTEQQILTLLREHAGRGAALLIVTHSAAAVAAADRVITLTDGRITP